MNMTTMAIDFFAWLGLAYDLKTVPEHIVKNRVKRTGDGSHPYSLEDYETSTANAGQEEEEYCEILPTDK